MTAATLLLDDARARLRLMVERLKAAEPLHIAFAAWLSHPNESTCNARLQAEEAAQRGAGERTFKDVAVIGFVIAAGESNPELATALRKGLDWLIGRTPLVNGQPAGFCTNGVALLGVALGAQALADTSLSERATTWLSAFVAEGSKGRKVADWERPIFSAAAHLLGVEGVPLATDDSTTADVRVALRGRGILPTLPPDAKNAEDKEALMIIRTPAAQSDVLRAAIRLAALDLLLKQAPTLHISRPTLSELTSLLQRVEAGLRRWTWEEKARTRGATPRKWYIDNEYHVQNLLWMLLSPVFPDLCDEVYTEAFGQLHPRIDLGIPSLKVIIEVKFVRMGTRFAKVVEEISSDVGVYLSRPAEYEHLIPFIWDDSARVQEHDYLRTGLLKLRGIVDAVVVSRPANFNEFLPAETSDEA